MVSDLSNHTLSHPMMGWRYSLTRCLGRTALADVYWARDLEIKDTALPEAHVLLLKVSPALSQLNGFEDALYEILMPFTEPSSPVLPVVTDSGNDNGTLWLVLPHTEGKLLSDSLQHGGKDTKRLLQEFKPYLSTIATSLTLLKAPIYGFLEPAALQFYAQHVRFLNAPLVYALRHYIKQTAGSLDYRLTLNSGYISPAVAVGDMPQTEDDVFSLACMSYHFLTGDAPFKKQHTLEAVVRHTHVTPVKGLPHHAQDALAQGLTLQPGVRQASVALFIAQLTKRATEIKLLLPAAVAAAVTITGLAINHLVQRAENYLDHSAELSNNNKPSFSNEPKPNPEPQQPSTVQGVALQPNLGQTPVGASFNAPSAVNNSTPDLAFTNLNQELQQQLALGSDANLNAVINKIREHTKSTKQQEQWLALITQAIQHEHTQAQTFLNNKALEEANSSLIQASGWIKEFNLADQSVKQASLEQQLKTAQAEQVALEQLLAQAQTAVAQQRWTHTNGVQNAASLLTQVLTRQPQHPEAKQLLLDVVKRQQDTIQQQLNAKTIQQTQLLLTDTAALISQYSLEPALTQQIHLEAAYQTLKTAQPELVQVPETETTTTKEAVTTKLDSPQTTALSAQDITQAIEQAAPIATAPALVEVAVKPTTSTQTPVNALVQNTTSSTPNAPKPRPAATKPEAINPKRPIAVRPPVPAKTELVHLPARNNPRPVNRPYAPSLPPRSLANNRVAPPNTYNPALETDYSMPMRRADRAYAVPMQPRRAAPPQYRTPPIRVQTPRQPAYYPPNESVDELIEVPLSTLLD